MAARSSPAPCACVADPFPRCRETRWHDGPMPTPQPGIFAQGTRVHRLYEFDVRSDADAASVRDALAGLRQPSVTAGGANIVVGFGPELWRRQSPRLVPDALADFPTLAGVPVAQHDLWIWVHGTGDDLIFDIGQAVAALVAPVADLASEVGGWVYRDSRDLTGFVDGTENPAVEEAFEVATVAEGPGAGG